MRSIVNRIWMSAAVILTALALAPDAPATLSVYVPPEDLADRAPLAIEGTVVETASGFEPRTGRLATYVTIDVVEVHRGPAGLERVTLREPGGRFGDLVHDVDAVPDYVPGEDVFVFLEPGRDGALRTAGMFFGKFRLVAGHARGSVDAVRDLDGRGTIVGRTGPRLERFRRSDLRALLAGDGRPAHRTLRERTAGSAPSSWSETPPEIDELLWDAVHRVGPGGPATLARTAEPSDPTRVAAELPDAQDGRFVLLSSSNPARWFGTDSGDAIRIDVERARDPLGDPEEAVATIADAMAAWTGVPESRLTIEIGDDDADHTGAGRPSPASSYPAGNIVLFGDPYGDISDPSSCAGVLAIGGYWRSGSTGGAVNGTTFHPALRAYVIFNNDFECFLGLAGNLAEVATHELGHAVGFGHSLVPDAVMRSTAYGWGRGARLGNDDRDAAHCVYPHTLELLDPDGGEALVAGSARTITWSATPEAGGDPGQVDLEYSLDSGSTWTSVEIAANNDGAYVWSVPQSVGDRYRFRVMRPNRVQPSPSPWPSVCSQAVSGGDFAVVAPPPVAGQTPDGAVGAPLRIDRDTGGGLALTWGTSCSGEAGDYAVYTGTLAGLRAGSWDHAPVTCSTGGATGAVVDLPDGDRYFLIAPLAGTVEGRFGVDSSGLDRPASGSACAVREATSTCAP